MIYEHACSVCGHKVAPWGYDTITKDGKTTVWYCSAHNVDRLQTKALANTPQKPRTLPEPEQGDLF